MAEPTQWWHVYKATGEQGSSITITVGPTEVSPDEPTLGGTIVREQRYPCSEGFMGEKMGPEAAWFASFTHHPTRKELDIDDDWEEDGVP